MNEGAPAESDRGAGSGRAALPPTIQATVHSFDTQTGDGSVITDDGLVLPFDAAAWSAGRLLTLRAGQRLRVEVRGHAESAHVTSMTLVTFTS